MLNGNDCIDCTCLFEYSGSSTPCSIDHSSKTRRLGGLANMLLSAATIGTIGGYFSYAAAQEGNYLPTILTCILLPIVVAGQALGLVLEK